MDKSFLDRIRAEAQIGAQINLFLKSGTERSGTILEIGPETITLLTQGNRRLTVREVQIEGWEVDAPGVPAHYMGPVTRPRSVNGTDLPPGAPTPLSPREQYRP